MTVAVLESETDFVGWRNWARRLRAAEIRPDQVSWQVGSGLFDGAGDLADGEAFVVPKDFPDLARSVICHRDPGRFQLLYRILWRLKDEPNLLRIVSDADVAHAREMAKTVSRSSHKMKAFVRFREMEDAMVAWFEPAHRVLERTFGHFTARYPNMKFSILTPDACGHWDGEKAALTPGADKSAAPDGDDLEEFWRTYYGSIFNPARLKVQAMQSEMPKRYWRNLPEASLIPGLIAQAEERLSTMVHAEPVTPKRRVVAAPVRAAAEEGAIPASLGEIAEAIQTCKRCDLGRQATQAVAGEGPKQARLMLIGEQPGDQEDLAGKPFIGPAGQVLNRALDEAGVPRAEIFVTNAVKHFKHEPRGKRRLHKTPEAPEINACRFWQVEERRLVKPRLVLAMGATATQSLLGKAVPIGKSRGQLFQLEDQSQAMVTMHPSYILRLPDEAAKADAYKRLVEDLAAAWQRAAV